MDAVPFWSILTVFGTYILPNTKIIYIYIWIHLNEIYKMVSILSKKKNLFLFIFYIFIGQAEKMKICYFFFLLKHVYSESSWRKYQIYTLLWSEIKVFFLNWSWTEKVYEGLLKYKVSSKKTFFRPPDSYRQSPF